MISNSKYLSENIRDMSQDYLVSVVVLNYNAGELLLNCIKSIKKSTYKNLEIIVVDNISNDNSHEICKKEFNKKIEKEEYSYVDNADKEEFANMWNLQRNSP